MNERQKKIIPNKNLINKKLALYNTEFDFKEFREKIEMMRNLWQIDLKNLMIGELPEFDKIKKEISQKFKDL
ncbi:MAG: hypothetical protein KJ968_03185 [Nanoarchaeota archaeon]|nr:hypothetical protein [Nanoarchaeota archaeon]